MPLLMYREQKFISMADSMSEGVCGLKIDCPVFLETEGWPDYALLDMGDGEKLEQYGTYRIVRPELQALGKKRDPAIWRDVDAAFAPETGADSGRWRYKTPLTETWPMHLEGLEFLGRFTAFRHMGFFPEQKPHWDWMLQRIKSNKKKQVSILNLFGYTGVASLIAARAGAHVTHIDASKKAIGWARENQAHAGLEALPIRWICEDAHKFVEREVRRGNRYDGILLDPPKFGRGPKGESWDIFEHLPLLLQNLKPLLDEEAAFMILTAYSIRASFVAFHELMAETFHDRAGHLESGELILKEKNSTRRLSTSLFCRCSFKT